MKLTQASTIVVIIHIIMHALHGLAHGEIPIPLSLIQTLFVIVVVMLTPLIAVVLFWKHNYRIGGWLLLSSMAGSLLFGIYNHFIVISPDHVSQNSFSGWGFIFQITAIILLLVDAIGCGVGLWALKAFQPQKTTG